jgi:hypothetical protein
MCYMPTSVRITVLMTDSDMSNSGANAAVPMETKEDGGVAVSGLYSFLIGFAVLFSHVSEHSPSA